MFSHKKEAKIKAQSTNTYLQNLRVSNFCVLCRYILCLQVCKICTSYLCCGFISAIGYESIWFQSPLNWYEIKYHYKGSSCKKSLVASKRGRIEKKQEMFLYQLDWGSYFCCELTHSGVPFCLNPKIEVIIKY